MTSQLRGALMILTCGFNLGCALTNGAVRNTSYNDSAHPEFKVLATEYTCGREPSRKSLIILPPTGGTNLIDRSYAKAFCKGGYDVYILDNWSREDETGTDLGYHQRAYTNSQHAIRVTLDRLKTPFIGVLGTSLGATHASVAANTFTEIDAVFFIVGGVPLPEVIATSDNDGMLKFHKARFDEYKFKNDDDYAAAILREFRWEPTLLGKLHESKAIGAVVSTNDTTVPYKTQRQLVEFYKPTTLITRHSSHFWAIVKTWLFDTDKLIHFFDDASKKK